MRELTDAEKATVLDILELENRVKELTEKYHALRRAFAEAVLDGKVKDTFLLKHQSLERKITVEYPETAKYNVIDVALPESLSTVKVKGEEWLYSNFPSIRDGFAVSFKEKEATLKKLLTSLSEAGAEEAKEILEFIKNNRTVSRGLPTVSVK